MFERIGLEGRPLIDRIASAHDHITFGRVETPMFPGQEFAAAAPEGPRPSLVDGMFEPAHFAPTAGEGLAAISRELAATLTATNEEGKELILAWTDFRQKLESYFDARTSDAKKVLETQIEALTAEGRGVIDRIAGLVRDRGNAQGFYSALEESASPLRTRLMELRSQNPDLDLDNSFLTHAEREAWRKSLREAESAVSAKTDEQRPVLERIQRLDSEIQTASRELERIRRQRRALRLELLDGRKRDPAGGLGGMI